MNKKLGRYLETYKRLFFKGQIDNPKSIAILQQKRISLGLSVNETDEALKELSNKFNDIVSFIENILEFSDLSSMNKEIDNDDKDEIIDFWRDLDISDDDGEKILALVISKFLSENLLEDNSQKEIASDENYNFSNCDSNNYYKEAANIEAEVIIEEDILNEEDYLKSIERGFRKQCGPNIHNTGIILAGKKEKTLLEEYKEIIEKNKNSNIATMQVRLLNLVIGYGLGFEGELFSIENRKEVTATNMVSIFKANYYEFLNDLVICVKESGAIDLDNVPEYTLEEFFNYEIILKYAEKIDILNKAIDDGEDETTFAWLARSTMQFESRKIMSKLTAPVVEYVVKVIRNCKGKRAISNEKEFKAFKVIDDILVMMIANLTNRALYNVNELINKNIYNSTLDLIQIIDSKQKGLVHLEELKKVDTKSDKKKYSFILASALKAYPYLEEAHLGIIDILSENDMSIRKYLLERAYKVIESSGECCNLINSELIEIGNKIYTESIESLNYNELEFDEIRRFCEELQSKFNITDANTIVQTELNNFGRVISVVNYKNVNEDIRIKLYRKAMLELKKNNSDEYERNTRCAYLREHYNIEDQQVIIDTELSNFNTIVSQDVDFSLVEYDIRRNIYESKLNELQYEYDQGLLETLIIEARVNYKINLIEARDMELMKFGRWFGELDLSDKEESGMEKYVRALSQNILMQPISEDKKAELLSELKEKSGFSTHEFYAIQNKIGNAEMALNDEDAIELEFIDKALDIFGKYPNMTLESKFCDFKDSDFHCGVFIRNFEGIRNEFRDKELFTLRKENNKDGFLITSKAIYHSNWDKPILFKNIKKVLWREKSDMKNSQRYFRPYIFIATAGEEFKFDFVGFKQIDMFKNFILDLINTYKMLLGEERCKYEECSVKSNSLRVEDMLSGNSIFSLYKGDFKNRDEIVSFILKYADSKVKRHIKFQNPKSSLDGKIKNAISSYASLNEGEKPILCFDSTIFKSAKEGFLLTTRGIYCKNKFGTPWLVKHEEMKFIKLQEEYLIFNERQTTIITVEESVRRTIREIIEFLSFMFKCIED